MSLRVGILGARRGRQGLGPFVARCLREAGAEVVGFTATSDATVAQACDQLREMGGVNAPGFTDGNALVDATLPDALAILTPPEHHGAGLRLALDAGLHALCEKPFLWTGGGDLDEASRLVAGFADAGLVLRENCQWPYTLPAWRALHDDAPSGPPARFAMRMAPASQGVQMIADALPHPISVLQAIAPAAAPQVLDPHFSAAGPDAEELSLRFGWQAGEHTVECLVDLSRSPNQPREAGYALDGRWGHRLVRTADYAQFLASGARLAQATRHERTEPLATTPRPENADAQAHDAGSSRPRRVCRAATSSGSSSTNRSSCGR
jgi:hypothetical protein